MARPTPLLLLPAALLLGGCPFESRVPLADPDPTRFEERLAGEWTAIDETGGDTTAVTILRFNRAEYLVELQERDSEEGRFRAYVIDLGGEPILQLNELETGDRAPAYVFARYALDAGGRLHLRFIGDRIVPDSLAADAPGLQQFLRAHAADPLLDDEDTRLVLERR
jgi:hypothetical protein